MKLLVLLTAVVTGALTSATSAQMVQTPTVAPPAVAPPVATPTAKLKGPRAPRIAAAPNPNLVEAKLKSGRVVHYDCTKKGNVHKLACKS